MSFCMPQTRDIHNTHITSSSTPEDFFHVSNGLFSLYKKEKAYL